MATHTSAVRRFARGPLHGTALALYFVLLPFVVVSKWELAAHQSDGPLIRALLVALACFWVLFLFQVGHQVIRLLHGATGATGGSAWLAGVVVALATLLSPSGVAGALVPGAPGAPVVIGAFAGAPAAPGLLHTHPPTSRHLPAPPDLATVGSLALALAAKQRGDTLRRGHNELTNDEIDDALGLLQHADPSLVNQLARLIGDQRDGVVRVGGNFGYGVISDTSRPLVAAVLEENEDGVLITFAREGGRLRVPTHWSNDQIAQSAVALHDGRLGIATSELELLRQLATRTLSSTLVLYVGPPGDIDDALRSCAVTIEALDHIDETGHDAAPVRPMTTTTPLNEGEIRVELLRASPQVHGLFEPFTATLRRRCIEMVAYLALHRGEPVTGERLRSRVLTHADVDASLRTLANTASAVRRSLGVDASGPRLHPVTSSGLYATHGLTCDVEMFHDLVTRARSMALDHGAALLGEALALVHGEPMANALRGFEWFLVEGYWARLLREGEWAALALHQWALSHDDVELAFWAIEQGRLLDPFNDALVDALSQVPRLRQFGGDGARRA